MLANPTLRQRYGLATPRPILALAPMAGVTDLPFRQLCEQLGADYSVTEMAASAPQLLHSEKNQTRLHFTPEARVKVLQIIGNHPEQVAQAAQHYAQKGAEIIDINLGCPAKKISKKGAGSALLSDLPLVTELLQAVVEACPVPVTVKTRLGPDHDNYTLLAIGQLACDLGIELVAVHGRTRACKFNGHAQFEEIARLKRAFPQLAVLANGDIDSVEGALQVLEQTACDGLMIGRGAVGRPWLFADIRARLETGYSASVRDKCALILDHIAQTHVFYGDVKGVRFARKHIQAYLNHLGLSEHFKTLAQLTQAEAQFAQLKVILES